MPDSLRPRASQDQAALNSMKSNANSAGYNVTLHNCQSTVNAGLDAAGLDHYESNVPNVALLNNRQPIYANDSGKVQTLE